MISSLQNRDRDIIWHPYTQMKDALPFIPIVRGEGSYLFDEEGNQYIDAVSSWWTNIHGHAHPYIAAAIYAQAQKLEQVIFAGFTHQPAVQLAEMLLQRIPFHKRVFYSDNGSTAVEVAIKMALQYWWNQGQQRKKMIAFKDAYHGDTFGAMSVSARGVFTDPFQNLLFEVEFIDTPTPGNEQHALDELNAVIQRYGADIAGFIFEPLVLGSAGMLMYSEQVLDEMMGICQANNILTIADEVMTGFGRTGKFLATDYCQNKPDIICLSKSITGGFLPFAATTCTHEIYEAFLSNDKAKMFFHGHSYTANPLGCAAGIASLELFEKEQTFDKILEIEKGHGAFASQVKENAFVKDLRYRGTILAIELKTGDEGGYLNNIRDTAYRFFMEKKIILRPLGHIIYIFPPFCTSATDMQLIYDSVKEFLLRCSLQK